MDDVRGDFLGPPHGTTPAAVIANKDNSGNEPSSVTLYKTGSESQTFCCNFKNLHLCSLNQRLKFPKGPINQNTVKMILNI